MSEDTPSKAPEHMPSYEIGYQDGESSAHADWTFAFDEAGIDNPGPSGLGNMLAAIRAQAFEEATKIAEQVAFDLDPSDLAPFAGAAIAAAIREKAKT